MFSLVLWRASWNEWRKKLERNEFEMMYKIRKDMWPMKAGSNDSRKYYTIFEIPIHTRHLQQPHTHTATHAHNRIFARTIELNWLWENYQPFINTYSYAVLRSTIFIRFSNSFAFKWNIYHTTRHYQVVLFVKVCNKCRRKPATLLKSCYSMSVFTTIPLEFSNNRCLAHCDRVA